MVCFPKSSSESVFYEQDVKDFSLRFQKSKTFKDLSIKFLKLPDFCFRYLVNLQIGLKIDSCAQKSSQNISDVPIFYSSNLSTQQQKELRHLDWNMNRFSELSFFENRDSMSQENLNKKWEMIARYETIRKILNGYSVVGSSDSGIFYKVTKNKLDEHTDTVVLCFKMFAENLKDLKFDINNNGFLMD